jgi:hypothetical protein
MICAMKIFYRWRISDEVSDVEQMRPTSMCCPDDCNVVFSEQTSHGEQTIKYSPFSTRIQIAEDVIKQYHGFPGVYSSGQDKSCPLSTAQCQTSTTNQAVFTIRNLGNINIQAASVDSCSVPILVKVGTTNYALFDGFVR